MSNIPGSTEISIGNGGSLNNDNDMSGLVCETTESSGIYLFETHLGHIKKFLLSFLLWKQLTNLTHEKKMYGKISIRYSELKRWSDRITETHLYWVTDFVRSSFVEPSQHHFESLLIFVLNLDTVNMVNVGFFCKRLRWQTQVYRCVFG